MKIVIPFLFILLFLFPAAAFEGARDGLLLWFNSVLPSLLPCLILSGLCIRSGIVSLFASYAAPVGRILFGISPDACYPAFLGFLAGLPAGAKAASDLTVQGRISREEAEYVITFCNNVSPMFLLSFAAAGQLLLPEFGRPLCLIVWFSSILSGRVIRAVRNAKKHAAFGQHPSYLPPNGRVAAMERKSFIEETDEVIMDSFRIMIKTAGYIILFSILAGIISSLPVPKLPAAAIAGVLETTTGIRALADLPAGKALCAAAVAACAAFGGLSGLAQTKSVTAAAGLTLAWYTAAKLLSSVTAAVLTLVYMAVSGL